MSEINVEKLRQLLSVQDVHGRVLPAPEVADRLGFSFTVDKDYGCTTKMRLGFYTRQPINLTTNDAKALFMVMGRELGVDVIGLLDELTVITTKRDLWFGKVADLEARIKNMDAGHTHLLAERDRLRQLLAGIEAQIDKEL